MTEPNKAHVFDSAQICDYCGKTAESISRENGNRPATDIFCTYRQPFTAHPITLTEKPSQESKSFEELSLVKKFRTEEGNITKEDHDEYTGRFEVTRDDVGNPDIDSLSSSEKEGGVSIEVSYEQQQIDSLTSRVNKLSQSMTDFIELTDRMIICLEKLTKRVEALEEGKEEIEHKKKDDERITVCDQCWKASCWQGTFTCAESRHAGTVQMSKDELQALGKEDGEYWLTDKELEEMKWVFPAR